MKIRLRKRKNNTLRKLVRVDQENSDLGMEPLFVRLEDVTENILEEGTVITDEVIDSIFWKEDEVIVFKNQNTNILPIALDNKTQIISKSNGEVWIIPSGESGKTALKIGINDNEYNEIFAHINSKINPHQITKNQIGLSNVSDFPVATNAVAEAGASNTHYMTPKTTTLLIDKKITITREENSNILYIKRG